MKNKKKISFWIFILILLLNASAGKALNPNIDTNLTLNNSNKLTIENPNENIGLIQRDYLADGTVIEKAQGLILDEDSTPGVEEGDNPLGVEQMRFLGINEIAFVCPGLTNNFADLNHVDINLIENQINDPEFDTMLDATCSYEEPGCQATDAASGDVNGDGKDELVIISKYGRVYIYEYNTSTHLFIQQVYNLDIDVGDDRHHHYSISLNQFNPDPGLEIAIGIGHTDVIQIWDPVNALGTYYTPGIRASVFGGDGGIAEVNLQNFLDPVHGVEIMDIETGDFNGNGYMDIVGLGARGDLFVVELDSGVLNLIGGPIALSGNQVQGYTHNFPQAIGIGDYNGDFLPDIAVMKCIDIGGSGTMYFQTNYYVDTIYWKGFDCGGTVLNNLAEVDVSDYHCYYPSIGMGDVDGDGLCETIVSGKIGSELYTDSWVVMIFEDFAHKLTGPKATFTGESQCSWAAKSFACTDVDLDGVDEICFSSVERYGNIWYPAYLEQPTGRHTSIVKFNSNANPWEATVLHHDENKIGFPVIGDYDGDGIVLEYSGNHYPRFTPQMPIFVLAAPPTYFDLNGEGSGSSVSTSQSTTTDVSEQFSVMAGIKVSYEAGFEIFGQGVKFRASVEANYQFTQTGTTMESETIGIQYSSGYEDNQIIYNVVDYESYIYNIVKHPFNDMIGKNMSIDIPIGVNIYSTTESLYENSGSGTNVIGPETYNHVVGQPGTYPTLEDVNEYTGVVQILEKTVVPQGSSINCGTTLSYIREEASSVENEHSMALISSIGGEVGGFGLDVSVGYGSAWANKVTYGKSMAYEGSVACIGDESSWSKKKYSWGMFIQNIEPDAGFSFQLIHYYTEGNFTGDGLSEVLDAITDFISENPVQSIAIGVGGIGVITGVVLIAKRKGRGKR